MLRNRVFPWLVELPGRIANFAMETPINDERYDPPATIISQ